MKLKLRRGQVRILEAIIACGLVLMTYFFVQRTNYSVSIENGSDLKSAASSLLTTLEDPDLLIGVINDDPNWEAQLTQIIRSSLPAGVYYNVTFTSLLANGTIIGSPVTNMNGTMPSGTYNSASVDGVYSLSFPVVRENATKLDVMLVMDRSGSMNDRISGDTHTKIYYTKIAAKSFIDNLNTTTDYVGLSSFSTSGSLDQQLTGSLITVKNAIDALVASGYTNMYEGLSKAHDEFLSPRARTGDTKVLILLSDGNANRPTTSPCLQAENEADVIKAMGAKIFTIGLGNPSDLNSTLLTNIQTDGYYRAPSAQDLDQIYQSIAEKIMTEVRYDVVLVTVTLKAPVGV